MFVEKLVMECKGESGNIYRFECSKKCTLGEAHDMLCNMKNEIVNQMISAQKKDDNSKCCNLPKNEPVKEKVLVKDCPEECSQQDPQQFHHGEINE